VSCAKTAELIEMLFGI